MRRVTVSAPSRLHFGLWSLGDGPQAFGGIGVMVDAYRVELAIEDAGRFTAEGPLAERAQEFAKTWAAARRSGGLPRCRVTITQAPPAHRGLGSGTQLALAVATGLEAWTSGNAAPPATELAALVGRGGRSSVGVHGFVGGGLIVDGGHDQPASPGAGRLEQRIAMPDGWRVLLLAPEAGTGLSGEHESAAFRRLASPPRPTADALRALAINGIAAAARRADFPAFADALGRYSRAAGEVFAPIQGGPFASSTIAAVIDRLQELGAAGAGQSSWGPTVFAVAASEADAQRLRDAPLASPEGSGLVARIARFDNRGAIVRMPPAAAGR